MAAALEIEARSSRRSSRELGAGSTGASSSGRGFEYATAREWALKLKELAQVFADPYSAADFLHGPIALVQPGIPVLVLAPEGAAAAGQIELLRDLRARGVDTRRRLGRRRDARARPLVRRDSRRRAGVAPAGRLDRPGAAVRLPR